MSMGFSRQEYWSGLPFPPPGDLPDPGIKPAVPALQADSLLLESPGKSPESHDSAEHFHLFISSFILRAAPGNQHSYLHFTDAETACNVGDFRLIPGSGRSPGGGNGTPLQ